MTFVSVLLASSVLPTLREESYHSKKNPILQNLKNINSEKKDKFGSFFPDRRFARSRKIFVLTGRDVLSSSWTFLNIAR